MSLIIKVLSRVFLLFIFLETSLYASSHNEVKVLFHSLKKRIPLIGEWWAVLDDIKIENKMSNFSKKSQKNSQEIIINQNNIQENSNKIMLNTKLINDLKKRVEEENKILDSKIEGNSQNIIQIYANLKQTDEQIVQITNNIIKVEEHINKNTHAIEKINNAILKTGIDELFEYYETNNSYGHLNNAYHDFRKVINIQQKEIQPIVYFYYIITLTEMQGNHPQKVYLTEIEQYFQKLVKLEKEEKVDFSMLLTTYAIVKEYHLENITKEFLTSYSEKIEKYYANHKFEQAYFLAKIVSYYGNSQAFDRILKTAQLKRERNFKKYKNFSSKNELFATLKIYENELLLKEACRYLYNNRYYDDLSKLLSEQHFKENDFKLKVYLSLYKKKNDLKYTKLKQLIANNSTYSKELKSYSHSH